MTHPRRHDRARRARARVCATLAVVVAAAVFTGDGGAVINSGSSSVDQANGSKRYEFRDVGVSSGVDIESRTWGAAWTDHDRDGDADLFVGRHWREPLLITNENGQYTRQEIEAFLSDEGTFVDRHGCAWGEANGDGRPDLYCTQGADRGKGSGPNQLFLQTDSGFEDAAARFGVDDPLGRGRTLNWLDHDSDGDLDLFVGNTERAGVGNVLFRNAGNRFRRVDAGVADETRTVSSSWADWDVDGDPDLLVLRHHLARDDNGAIAYENEGGRFRSVSLPNVTGRQWNSAAWGDYNGDGWPDLHVVRDDRAVVLRNAKGDFRPKHKLRVSEGRMSVWFDVENDGDLDLFLVRGARGNFPRDDTTNRRDLLIVKKRGGFEVVSDASFRGPRAGNGDAVVASDHDRDGRVDLLVTNGFLHWAGPVELLENRSTTENWIGIDLDGGLENPWGFGAIVKATTPDDVIYRQVTDGFSFRSQSETGYVHIGIAGAAFADVVVTWPGGARDCISVAAGTVVEVSKGNFACR